MVSVANVASLSGLPTTDAVSLVDGNVQLLTAQTTQAQNGPWVVHAGAWTRPAWWASAASIPEGNYFILDPDGSNYKNTKWFTLNTGPIVVDTTAVTFTQDQSGTSYTNGNGLSLAGTTFAVVPQANSGISVSGSGVAAVANAANLITIGASGIGITPSSAAAQLMLGNASNVPTWTTLSGDVSISATGVASVNNAAGSGFLKYGAFVANETPGGTVNGSNAAFTLANTPQWLQLLLNGVVLEVGSGNDYTISGAAITMLLVPASGDKLRAYYTR